MGVLNTCLIMVGEPKQFHGFSLDSYSSSLTLSSKGEVTSGVKLRNKGDVIWKNSQRRFSAQQRNVTLMRHFFEVA